MRAAVLDADLAVREWDEPRAGPGEALVALTKAGICGSDVHFVIDGTARTAFRPIVLGHEPAGRIEALGPDTDGPAPGTRVAVIPLVTCQECEACRRGRLPPSPPPAPGGGRPGGAPAPGGRRR